jgi:hypothetical protein
MQLISRGLQECAEDTEDTEVVIKRWHTYDPFYYIVLSASSEPSVLKLGDLLQTSEISKENEIYLSRLVKWVSSTSGRSGYRGGKDS